MAAVHTTHDALLLVARFLAKVSSDEKTIDLVAFFTALSFFMVFKNLILGLLSHLGLHLLALKLTLVCKFLNFLLVYLLVLGVIFILSL